MSRDVLLFQTHVFTPRLQEVLAGLASDVGALLDVRVLFDETGEREVPRTAVAPVHTFDREALLDRWGAERFFPGYTNLPALDFRREHPGWDRYWVLEYDVRFSGSWRVLFEHFADSGADLLAAGVRRWRPDSSWYWWQSLEGPGERVPSQERLAAFLPIVRYSGRALDELSAAYRGGWRGHSEIVVPTVLDRAGMELRDFGGRGDWVAPSDRNRFYVAPPREDLLDDRRLRFSTFRWRPSFRRVGWRRNKIYHPVKEPGWDRGHLQPDPHAPTEVELRGPRSARPS